jgi:hypothetical protein
MEAHESFLSSRQKGGGLGATREGTTTTTTTTTTTKKKEILKLCSESLHRRRFEDVLTLTSGLFKKKKTKEEKKEEEKEKKAFQVCINIARARAHASLQQFEECLKECNEILQMKPNLAVANWLKAKALIGLGGAYEARIYLYKCRRSLSISSNTTKSANEKQTSKRMNENDELEVEIEAVEETCKHALPDDPELRVEKRGGNKRGSKKNVTVKSKKNEKGDEDDEADEDEEGEEIYLIENEKTDDDKEEKTSADVTKSSMTSWADEVEQEQTEEERRGEIPFIASIPMVSFVHLAIENDDAKKDCLDSLKKYGSVRVAMPDEAFDISLGETLAKVIECFESEYYESDDVEFFAPAWELNVDEEENVVEEKQVVVVEEDKKEEDLAEKSEGYLSYANIAKKNARLRSNGFNATESKANEISMFPPLSLKNDKLEREWNEPPAEEDADPRPARRRETKFPSESFGTAVADATQILEMVAMRVVRTVLRQSFQDIHEEKRQFHSIFNNLEGPSEEFLESQRKRNTNARESFILRAQSGTLITRDDDDDSDDSDERNPSSTSEKEFTEHQNLFLTCDWLYDASLASDAKKSKRRTKGERRKAAAKPSQKYFTSNVELDGPIVHFTVGPALRKKYASVFSLSASDDEDPKGYKKTVSDGKRLVRFSLRDE